MNLSFIDMDCPENFAVIRPFLHWLIMDPDHGVFRFTTIRTKAAVSLVASMVAKSSALIYSTEEWQSAKGACLASSFSAAYNDSAYASARAGDTAMFSASAMISLDKNSNAFRVGCEANINAALYCALSAWQFSGQSSQDKEREAQIEKLKSLIEGRT